MRVVVSIASGAAEGRRVLLRAGQTVTVGRTEMADFTVPDDSLMSGLHFAISCTVAGCRVKDLGSSNGTSLNGSSVSEVAVQNGDQVVAGRTRFHIRVDGQTAPERVPGAEADRATGNADVAAREPQEELLDEPIRGPLATTRRMPAPLPSPIRSTLPYAEAFRDEDPGVRREALLAAAWTRESWLLDHCRQAATEPCRENQEAVDLLAILGQPADLERVLAVGREPRWGIRRFAALAAFGHPVIVPELLIVLAGEDPIEAVAAGQAFMKLTGVDIETEQRVTLPPEDGREPDEVEQEFLDEAFLPDAELAKVHWADLRDRCASSSRLRQGFDISGDIAPDVLAQLDMQARWELTLRRHYRTRDNK